MNRLLCGQKIKFWILLSLFFQLFYTLVVLLYRGDIVSHVLLLLQYIDEGSFPYSTFLYYGCVHILATLFQFILEIFSMPDFEVTELGHFFKNERTFSLTTFICYIYASILLLSIATVFKFALVKKIILTISPGTININHLNIIVFLLLFIHPISILCNGAMYFGYLPYISWHNSTTIFIMPFTLWILYLTIKWFNVDISLWLLSLQLIIFLVLSTFIKPSFLFVFGIAFPLINFFVFYFKKQFWLSILLMLMPIIVLGLQYYSIYILEDIPRYKESSGVVIKPFAVWGKYSDHIFLQSVLSYIFPITAIIFLYNYVKQNPILWLLIINAFVGVLIYSLFAEDGPRFTHANFSWQVLIANYLLFIGIFSFWMKHFKFLPKTINTILGFTCSLHIVFGFIYVFRMFIYGTIA